MRRDPRQRAALSHKQPEFGKTAGLKRPHTAVHRLHAVGGGATAEVAAVDERDRESALGCIPRYGGAIDAGTDDQQVEVGVGQCPKIPYQDAILADETPAGAGRRTQSPASG